MTKLTKSRGKEIGGPSIREIVESPDFQQKLKKFRQSFKKAKK